MKTFSRFMLTAFIVSLCTSLANAAVITTTFVSNNEGDGNMFDVATSVNNVRITNLSVHTFAETGTQTLYLYTRTGTFLGNESSSAGWTLHDTVVVNNAATPVNMDILDFDLGANSISGFYVVGDLSNSSLRYTNGGFSVADADLTLSGGVGISFRGGNHFSPAAGTVFSPRTWNGSITYDVLAVPEPSSAALILGALGLLVVGRRITRH